MKIGQHLVELRGVKAGKHPCKISECHCAFIKYVWIVGILVSLCAFNIVKHTKTAFAIINITFPVTRTNGIQTFTHRIAAICFNILSAVRSHKLNIMHQFFNFTAQHFIEPLKQIMT